MVELGIDHFLTKKLESKLQVMLGDIHQLKTATSSISPATELTVDPQKDKSFSKTSSFKRSGLLDRFD